MPTAYQKKPILDGNESRKRGRAGHPAPEEDEPPRHFSDWEIALDQYLADPLRNRDKLAIAVALQRGEAVSR